MRIYKTLLPINICYFIFSYFYKFHVFSFYLKKLHRVNYHNSCGYLENEKVIPGTSININQCFCEYGKKGFIATLIVPDIENLEGEDREVVN